MRKISTFIILFAAVLAAASLVPAAASAQNNSARVKQASETVKEIKRLQRRLRTQLGRLSGLQMSNFVTRQEGSTDSDDDGLPDLLEVRGSNVCNRDSDSDGIADGQEVRNGSKPDDSDSDDDGISDLNEHEVKGAISGLSSSTVSIGDATFSLTSGTSYLGRRNEALQQSDFAVGDCVEVEGHLSGGTLTAAKVKKEDDCGTSTQAGGTEVEVKGLATEVTASAVVVSGQTFVVTPQTQLLDDDNNPIQLAGFAVGQCVEAEGRRNVDGTVQAEKIKKDNDC